MNLTRLSTLGARRQATRRAADIAHRRALDAVLEELERAGEQADIQAAAKAAGIARGTVYRELGRRQTTRDELTSIGPPPAAPHDKDRVDVLVVARKDPTDVV